MTDSFLRLPHVCARVGLGKSTIWARIKEGTFPAPVNLGGRAVAWSEREVTDWMQARIAATREGGIRRAS